MPNESEYEPQETPFDLIRAFERCANYPREAEGVIALAQGLRKASDTSGIPMKVITDRCVELSEYCPTDHDLLTVASEIKTRLVTEKADEARRTQETRWRKECGSPEKFQCDWSLFDVRRVLDERAEIGRKIVKHLGISTGNPNVNRRSIQNVSWHDYFTAQRELGYPLTADQQKYL